MKCKLCLCVSLALVYLLVGSGCATTIRSKPIGSVPKPGTNYGVVYQLTRPEFKIVRTEATDKSPDKYVLALTHVPDNTHRYGLNVEAGFFSTADQITELRDDGSLSGLTVESKEHVTPTIKAIGDFAVSIVGAASAGLFAASDREKLVLAEKVGELVSRAQESSLDDPTKQRLSGILDTARERAAGDIDKFRVELYAAMSEAEVNTLLRPFTGTNGAIRVRRDADKQAYLVEQLSSLQPTSDPFAEWWLSREWETTKQEIELAVGKVDVGLLIDFATREEADIDGIPLTAIKAKNRELALKAKAHALSSADLSDLIKKPPSPSEETTADKQRKRVAELLKLIDAKEAAWIGANAPARVTIQSEIEDIRREIAQLTGAEVEYDALTRLQSIIRGGPPRGSLIGQGRPMQEYADAKAQWLVLQTDMLAKLEKLVKTKKPIVKKSDIWGEENAEPAWLWNVSREQMELNDWLAVRSAKAPGDHVPVYLPRLLRFRNDDGIMTRVRIGHGNDVNDWPNFVVELSPEAQR